MSTGKPWIHDQGLVDRLGNLPKASREFVVFRVTGLATDPIAPSISGGRWAPPVNGDVSFPVLYTSLAPDGAIAEVVSFLANLNPIPKGRRLRMTRLAITTSRTVELTAEDLKGLGVEPNSYGVRDYLLTQKIGAALAFLEVDGLVTPSARWDCQNLTVFSGNHGLDKKLEVIESEEVEWRDWAIKNSFF
ncbi:RES family NAD+ phosphorylase [soil metagenome]